MGYRQVPERFYERLRVLGEDSFMVGASRDLPTWADVLALLAARAMDDELIPDAESVFVPGWSSRYARMNVRGHVRLRRDLPKVEKTFYWEAPNFGRSDTHPITSSRMVWQRELIHGRSMPISVRATPKSNGRFVVTVRAEHLFDNADSNPDDMLMACSLVQEALHTHAIPVPASLSREEWDASLVVQWDFLPPGNYTADTVYGAALSRGTGTTGDFDHDVLLERIEMIQSTEPGRVVIGTSGVQRYVGFQYRDDLVAMENFSYGNALYLFYEDWSVLSTRSRLELLSGPMEGFDRVVHAGRWRDQFRNLLTLHGHDSTSVAN